MPSLFHLRAVRTLSVAALLALVAGTSGARSADAIFAPGQPIVTGFSGVVPPEDPPAGSDPLDYTFIDLDGASAVIQSLEPEDPPAGQLIAATAAFSVAASDSGQVFGVALDNADDLEDAAAPNIYLAATTAFGVHLVMPDADGNPIRTRTGGPEASFMAGQWGAAGGDTGYPGSIWMVDGETGDVSLFTTIGSNSGPGLGDIVFDPSSTQFFVSDLDTGLIYRLDPDGIIIDSFDHGVDGRPEHELEIVEDDGSAMDIADPAFSTEDPATWGFTQPERKVFGLATRGGRLYYAVFGQVWSVRIGADGSFGTARWELDVNGLLAGNEITDILFDPQGRMVLAQRGPQAGSYDYAVFAAPRTSSVVRYEREFPADPATPGTWVETPDTYAIGFAPDGAAAAGGIALGPRYNPESNAFDGACDAWLWATGDSLRDNLNLDDPLDPPTQVHGLQGSSTALVLPGHVAAETAFMVDYDGNTNDDQAAAQGHVGGVAIWQECTFDADTYVDPVLPFDDFDDADDFDDEDEFEGEENLTLEKWSSPYFCFDGGANWHCSFTIRVENTGDEPYWGPVVVDDYLPDNNPGAAMHFWPQPPWHCNPTGPAAYQCVTGPVLLYPGDGVVLHEVVTLPKALVGYCELVNVAGLNWFWDDDDDSSDDFNIGVAGIPAPGCVPPGGGSDLTLEKVGAPNCVDSGADWTCTYAVIVQNAGPDNFSGPITVTDTLGLNTPATVFGPWACAQAGPVLTCNIIAAPVNVPPGWTSGFFVSQTVPKPAGPTVCDLENRAVISTPAGGTPTNVNAANDDDDASSHIPEPVCAGGNDSDIEVTKTGLGCGPLFGGFVCEWQVTVENIGTDPYAGPFSMKDVSGSAVVNTLTSVYAGFCTGPAASVTCSTPGAFLMPGVTHTFTFHTGYLDGPAVCSATNTISVLGPNPGSPMNPAGNDSAGAMQAIPNPGCAPALLPRLNILKTATGCGPDPGSENWLCTFDITVLNYGGAPYPGPISVVDFNDKPTTFSGAACLPPGGAGFHTCTRPGPLNAGASWTFEATTTVNPNSVSLADCHVINHVWISNPPSGGDPGYYSQADQKVPQLFIDLGPGPMAVYCDPPSLELTKTHVKTVKAGDGYDSTFTVRATSTGPDPYVGTVEVDDLLPDGTSFVASTNWSCVPTTGNDVHCSSTKKTMPVGTYTEMTITMHIPADVAKAADCNVVNVVNASISADVLHADEGVQYTASAAAGLPASACREAPLCPAARVMPGGECCAEGTTWNGKQCAEPRPQCPADSRIVGGDCVCDPGTEGRPGRCEPIEEEPVCPRDSRIVDGECVCDPGTEGRPGRCEPIEEEPVCPRDSRVVNGECVCDPGTEGRPGRCEPIEEELVCPRDSRAVGDECVCDPGTEGRPGRCQPIEEELVCPKDSRAVNGECVCRRGTEGRPGRCQPIEEELVCPKDSRAVNGECVCRRGTEGRPGRCQPIEEDEPEVTTPQCPRDSRFDRRRNECVCNRPLRGEPGKCVAVELEVEPRRPTLRFPTIN
jgi:uncharacterized repeat protein (TIGR01451 family)